YRNLDEDPLFEGRNTTTEVLARTIYDRLAAARGRGELGSGAAAVESMRVTLHESHVASASFEGRLELLVLVVPGRPDTPTGGYVSDRRMVEGLRALGWHVEVCSLDGSFPSPSDSARGAAAAALASIPHGVTVLVDGLAGGAIPAVMEREAAR